MQYMNGEPWRDYVEKSLKEMGVIVFNPYNHPFINSSKEDSDATKKLLKLIDEDRYDEVAEIVRKIRIEDLRCVDICDFAFCHIDPKYPTCGTWEEIFWANRMKKPIFLSIEGGIKKTPLWMFGVLPTKYIYNSIDEALNVLRDINSGKKEIDNSRWHLLKKEYK